MNQERKQKIVEEHTFGERAAELRLHEEKSSDEQECRKRLKVKILFEAARYDVPEETNIENDVTQTKVKSYLFQVEQKTNKLLIQTQSKPASKSIRPVLQLCS
ncbi:MAG: hypothetical protein EZS28_016633 [Streblomastix strix]|uniref:Uncharacterized protein n=1 Tax=Streblomastix strix TaxID=222440 RepID=A0A5J4VZL1_9EUKA|nr:MAG: hypothetical protein EZS28_016633 [Streblomastix strix]